MKKPSETRDTPETTTGFDRVVNKERTAEETALEHAYPATQYGTQRVVSVSRVEELLQAERQKKNEAVEAERERISELLYDIDVEKKPSIQDEAWANQFNSKAEAFWYGEAQAISNIKEGLEALTN
jgi:hypothetical protein